jgi:hypothetical protein
LKRPNRAQRGRAHLARPFLFPYLHLGGKKGLAKLEEVKYYAFPFDVNGQESGLFYKSHRNFTLAA